MLFDVQKVNILRDPLYHGYYEFAEKEETGETARVPAEEVLCDIISKIIEKGEK